MVQIRWSIKTMTSFNMVFGVSTWCSCGNGIPSLTKREAAKSFGLTSVTITGEQGEMLGFRVVFRKLNFIRPRKRMAASPDEQFIDFEEFLK